MPKKAKNEYKKSKNLTHRRDNTNKIENFRQVVNRWVNGEISYEAMKKDFLFRENDQYCRSINGKSTANYID